MLDISHIKQQITNYKKQNLRLFASSSFQTHSIVLLHILSKIDKSIPIYFINTGYLFPETIRYKEQITELLGLDVQDVFSPTPKHLQKDEMGRLLFTSNPEFCCYLNKTQPLEPILAAHDVWISGIRADQSANRKEMKKEEKAPYNTLRYHPMLDWDSRMIEQYLKEYDLPRHPLEEKGYFSIGCEPCTRKFIPDDGDVSEMRDSRWFGMNKTECGLHTELVEK
ncbi:MAG: phosphoadenylyl-sulfate reductase [Bacteroidetes bacterium]|nr:phosphoadenylyl-sulfate reductase [Bacteroidota bacterium]